MAPRKPLTSVLKRDPSFGASLSLGPKKLTGPVGGTPDEGAAPTAPPADASGTGPKPGEATSRDGSAKRKTPETRSSPAQPRSGTSDAPAPAQPRRNGPGVSLSIAVSVAEADVPAVEAYADRALMTPQQLLRKIAQRAKHDIVGAWRENGFTPEDDTEHRGKLSTSISVTLPQSLADEIARAYVLNGIQK